MAARTYKIPVPYTTTGKDGLAISAGLAMGGAQDVLAHLKPEIVAKLERCGLFHHETFTKAELDSVPDALWVKLAPHLG